MGMRECMQLVGIQHQALVAPPSLSQNTIDVVAQGKSAEVGSKALDKSPSQAVGIGGLPQLSEELSGSNSISLVSSHGDGLFVKRNNAVTFAATAGGLPGA